MAEDIDKTSNTPTLLIYPSHDQIDQLKSRHSFASWRARSQASPRTLKKIFFLLDHNRILLSRHNFILPFLSIGAQYNLSIPRNSLVLSIIPTIHSFFTTPSTYPCIIYNLSFPPFFLFYAAHTIFPIFL